MTCPPCAATVTTEQARRTALGYRTLRCGTCRRRCNERTGTPFNHLQVPSDVALLVVLWRLRYKLSLRDLAERPASAPPSRNNTSPSGPPLGAASTSRSRTGGACSSTGGRQS